MSDRVRFIEHGIVLQDFSGLRVVADVLIYVAEARDFIERQPRGQALVLTDFTDATFDRDVVNAMRSLAEHHKPWVEASAIVGLTPLMQVVFRSVIALTRREVHVCETRAEGIAYLLGWREAHPAAVESSSAKHA
jgi:hypothetical protein